MVGRLTDDAHDAGFNPLLSGAQVSTQEEGGLTEEQAEESFNPLLSGAQVSTLLKGHRTLCRR